MREIRTGAPLTHTGVPWTEQTHRGETVRCDLVRLGNGGRNTSYRAAASTSSSSASEEAWATSTSPSGSVTTVAGKSSASMADS
jgi:hypothetical protein